MLKNGEDGISKKTGKSISFITSINLIDLSKSPESILEIMSQQWEDIHHSRNQDWMYWAIISAIIASILALFIDKDNPNINRFLITNVLFSVGCIISFWSAAISWSHWLLHIRKIEYIKWLSRFFFIVINNNKISISPASITKFDEIDTNDKFIVNGLIFSMYITIGVFFIVALVFNSFFTNILQGIQNLLPIIILILGLIILIVIYFLSSKGLIKVKNSYINYLDKIR